MSTTYRSGWWWCCVGGGGVGGGGGVCEGDTMIVGLPIGSVHTTE